MRDAAAEGDSYLWDGTGPPDPEVARLERLLGRYRLAAGVEEPGSRGGASRRWRRFALPALAAAAVLLVVLSGWRARSGSGTGPAYLVHGVPGVERAGAGSWIETLPDRAARLEFAGIGTVDLDPGARLLIDAIEDGQHRLFLERGRMEALILAAPRVFGVGTPAGESVDLGCLYELEVGADGVTDVRVIAGAVAFEAGERWVYVPGNAVCRATRELGPTSPVWREDIELLDGVGALERAAAPDPEDMERLLDRLDGLTLWHLLSARAGLVRRAALERLAEEEAVVESFDPEALVGADPTERLRLLERMPWYF